MRFTQKIIATFALFSICAYANPIGNQLDVSGLLMTREEAAWCGGMTDEECAEHCQLTIGTDAHYRCNPKYVNLKY